MRLSQAIALTLIIAGMGIGTVAMPQTPKDVEFNVSCDGDLCGQKLMRTGWRRDALCSDGHHWSYLLVKENKVLFCSGINTAAGPRELPCEEFRGDVNVFRQISAKPRDKIRGDECRNRGLF